MSSWVVVAAAFAATETIVIMKQLLLNRPYLAIAAILAFFLIQRTRSNISRACHGLMHLPRSQGREANHLLLTCWNPQDSSHGGMFGDGSFRSLGGQKHVSGEPCL